MANRIATDITHIGGADTAGTVVVSGWRRELAPLLFQRVSRHDTHGLSGKITGAERPLERLKAREEQMAVEELLAATLPHEHGHCLQ